MIFPRAQIRCTAALARPELIVFIAVAAVAVALAIVLLLPAPGLQATVRKLVPVGASIQSQVESQTAAALYCTTSKSLTNVADFFCKRLKLGRGAIIGGGIALSSQSDLFGRVRSAVVMPYGKEGFAIVMRERDELVAVAVSRSAIETITHIEIFAERLERPLKETLTIAAYNRTNAALSHMPPDGRHDSSGRGPGLDAAIFSTPTEIGDVAQAYSAERSGSDRTNLSTTPVGILSRPKRDGSDSVTFLATAGTNASIFVHCFRGTASTQTHVVASHVYK